MSQALLTHVFSHLLRLEKRHQELHALIHNSHARYRTQILHECEGAIKKMRLISNQLQIQIVRNNRSEIVRLLSIFYGLSSMVTPELSALLVPPNAPADQRSSPIQDGAVFH